PHYVRDLQDFVNNNKSLRHLDDQYDITGKLQEQAGKLPDKIGAAAGTLGSIGAGLVSSLFALVTILILTAFLLGSGARWFADFPNATSVWTIWSIVYQQGENSLIQPQIQKRTVNVNGFIVVVSVIFGSTLFGVLGALVAIPVAASIQIAAIEWWEWRAEQRAAAAAVSSTGHL